MENIENKNEQLYTIPLNDQGLNLYVKCGDVNVSFGYDEAVTFLMPVTKIVRNHDSIDVYLFSKKCFSIENGMINQYASHISATELRNIGMMLSGRNSEEYLRNEAYFNKSGLAISSNVKTELHTHLIEILDSERFLNFIERFNGKVKLDSNGVINFRDGTPYTVDQIRSLPILYNAVLRQLEIPIDRVGDFGELENKVENRTRLLLDVCDVFASSSGLGNADEAKVLVMKVLLHDSLVYLRDINVKYVEISHSNIRIIDRVLEGLDEAFFNDISGINFRFLFSSTRLKPAKDFRQNSRYLERALENQAIVGFDMMGLEKKFCDDDLKPLATNSIYKKLSPIIGVLTNYNNSVLRLHSGEFADTEMNTEQLLETIALIEKDNNIKIPPPEIRIGHGLHIRENPRLVELLKRYNCIVEINASSNFALSNVADLSQIPYQFYIDNGIRVVLSTDGGGFYRTSPEQERYIARTFAGSEGLDKLNKMDEEILKAKEGVIHAKSVGR